MSAAEPYLKRVALQEWGPSNVRQACKDSGYKCSKQFCPFQKRRKKFYFSDIPRQYYKTFYGRNLRIFVISQSVCPCKLFQPNLVFVGKPSRILVVL
jgi:hypothetical protein